MPAPKRERRNGKRFPLPLGSPRKVEAHRWIYSGTTSPRAPTLGFDSTMPLVLGSTEGLVQPCGGRCDSLLRSPVLPSCSALASNL